MTSLLAQLALLCAFGQLGDAPAQKADIVDRWVEAPVIQALNTRKVQLAEIKVQAVALAEGGLSFEFDYKLQNTAEAVTLELALPVGFEVDDPFVGGKVATDDRRQDLVVLFADKPLSVERKALPNGGQGDVFSLRLDAYGDGRLSVRYKTPWGRPQGDRMFPVERGFSVGLQGLASFDPPVETLDAIFGFDPPLLGPASIAEPRPYQYTSRDLDWNLMNLGPQSDQTPAPPRLAVRIFDEWTSPGFVGVLYAYWTFAADDDYAWNKRFLWLSPDPSPDQNRPIGADTLSALLRRADAVVNEVLARNGATFDDTFVQMQFQQTPWYKPKPGFSEDLVLPVEKWNLSYARCMQRAARTAQSMLAKTGNQTVDPKSSLYRMAIRPFKRCDETAWFPRPAQSYGTGRLDD